MPLESEFRGPAQDIDDDIDALDTIDADLFPIFADEAQELLPQLGGALRQWIARPDNGSARGEVLRNLHTLKGSARLAGALRLGEMAHRMETSVERLGSDGLKGSDLDPLQMSYDALCARFDLLRQTDPSLHGVLQTAPEQGQDAGPSTITVVDDSAVLPEPHRFSMRRCRRLPCRGRPGSADWRCPRCLCQFSSARRRPSGCAPSCSTA